MKNQQFLSREIIFSSLNVEWSRGLWMCCDCGFGNVKLAFSLRNAGESWSRDIAETFIEQHSATNFKFCSL